MPIENDTRVRVDGLSKRTATARGPASGVGASAVCRVALIEAARASTSACSAGAEVVVLEEVRGSRCGLQSAVSRRGGQGGDEGVDLRVGEDQRRGEPEHVRVRPRW